MLVGELCRAQCPQRTITKSSANNNGPCAPWWHNNRSSAGWMQSSHYEVSIFLLEKQLGIRGIAPFRRLFRALFWIAMTTATGNFQEVLAQQFGSDNYAGICPEAWSAMEEANRGFAPSYGDDPWTERASDAFRSLFETDCDVFFVFNGTAANSLALASLCQSYHG